MKTILVATDFSPAATNAANYAADMAVAIKADLLLLHSFQIPIGYTELPLVVDVPALESDAQERLVILQYKLQQRARHELNIRSEIRIGDFFHELEEVCDRIHPYMVVMGSHGKTAAARLFFGSQSIHAINNLNWPLLTVPPTCSFAKIKKIGLACDFHNVEEEIPVEELKMLVTDFSSELHVLNIGKDEIFDPEVVFESGVLRNMLADIQPHYHFVTAANTDKGINDFAVENNLDLLIVIPKRHTLLERLMKASHSKKLVLHSHVPVMALHH